MYKRHDLLWLVFRYFYFFALQSEMIMIRKLCKFCWTLLKVSANIILLRLHIKQPIAAVRGGISSKESGSFSNNCRKELEEVVWVSVFSHLELLLLCLSGDRTTADGSHHSFFFIVIQSGGSGWPPLHPIARLLPHIWGFYHSAQRETTSLIIFSSTENHPPPASPARGRISWRCHQGRLDHNITLQSDVFKIWPNSLIINPNTSELSAEAGGERESGCLVVRLQLERAVLHIQKLAC